MTKYDGKVNWKAWFMQFDDIADRRRWNYTTKLGKLKELLKDDALAYFSRLPLNVRESYRLLCEKMNLRFGQKKTPRTAQTQLFVIKQKDEEELEEWAERCMSVSMDGWQDQSEVVAQEQAVNAFLHGTRERDSALAVMDKEPASIDEAVRQMKRLVDPVDLVVVFELFTWKKMINHKMSHFPSKMLLEKSRSLFITPIE